MAIIIGASALAAGAIVGGVAGGSALHSKAQRDKARKIMIDCGPYFLNEGLTVQDLWTDFERRLKDQKMRRGKAQDMRPPAFVDLCHSLGYTETQTYLLRRTWLEGRRNPEILKQPYLRAMNNDRYTARACPEVRAHCEEQCTRTNTRTTVSSDGMPCVGAASTRGPVGMPRFGIPMMPSEQRDSGRAPPTYSSRPRGSPSSPSAPGPSRRGGTARAPGVPMHAGGGCGLDDDAGFGGGSAPAPATMHAVQRAAPVPMGGAAGAPAPADDDW